MKTCSIDDCDRGVTARGMCRMHYLQKWRNGEHLEVPTVPRRHECPADHAHDLEGCWAQHGCRCDQCQHLRRMERQQRRAKLRAYGREDQIAAPRVDAAPVREHVAVLQAHGFGLERIADAARVSRSVVIDLMYGYRGAKRRKETAVLTVRAAYANRLLALTADHIESAFVPAIGTARRLRALVTLGYTETSLAERIGMEVGNMSPIITGTRARVTAATHAAVRAMFDELWATPFHGEWSQRARRVAAENRWVGPLAWDDIDDPHERPNVQGEKDAEYVDDLAVELALTGERVRLTHLERREAVRRGHALRWSDVLLAERLNLAGRTVLRIRTDLGLEAHDFEDLVKRGAA